ncbi:MAG: polysaccharide biosynthesis tyrosine autokinase [Clostridia bacterium]|nr:polysaccharide biosynthesis tyrosine autokinase [Clostridia bacterium]
MANKKVKGKSKDSGRRLQLAINGASFQYTEAYKSLRTNLNFLAVGNDYKKIVITSSIPSEGKTNVAVNLALTLAESDKRVLLIDCDLRKPVLHKYLRVGHDVSGVTSLLSRACSISDAVVSFSDLKIDFLPAGPIPPNPAELLGSKRMQILLEELGQQYDFIILDTPPVSVVTDAAVLGHIADGVILVVRQNFVKIESAQLAMKNLKTVNANIIGAVLNDYNTKGVSKDSGYYYSYEYEYAKGNKK